jgi:hypothetical protein
MLAGGCTVTRSRQDWHEWPDQMLKEDLFAWR